MISYTKERVKTMCVIMIAEEARPNEIMVQKAWAKNQHGGGAAWVEGEGDTKFVVWKKGLSLEEMLQMARDLPLPYILHFRIASSGGIRPSLTHPIPISKRASLALEGKTKGYVLFHNGDWHADWEGKCLAAAIASNTPIPTGKWNDTRAIAWLMSIYGQGFMDFLPEQKGVAFGPNDLTVFTGRNGWEEINKVWCSNNYFLTAHVGTTSYTTVYMCKFGQCREKDYIDKDGFCPEHVGGVKQVAPISTGAGGSQTVTPFPPKMISLEVARKLSKEKNDKGERLVSKNLLKKIEGLYPDLHDKSRRGEKARRKLQNITQNLLPLLISGGPVH